MMKKSFSHIWMMTGASLLVIAFVYTGWGHWGMGVDGDYALDMADALRVYQGEIPHRDFIPTYGPLHIYLVAPIFGLGTLFFPVIWTLTAGLILFQLGLLMSLFRHRLNFVWSTALAILLVSAMFFSPGNAKFILGYSPSGFLASLLWTCILWLLSAKGRGRTSWMLAGVLMGLLPFTKVDMGSTVFIVLGVLLILGVANAVRKFKAMPLSAGANFPSVALLMGFLISGGTMLGIQFIQGAQPLLWSSTLGEYFAQAGIFGDRSLQIKIYCLFGFGAVVMMVLTIPWLRKRLLRFKAKSYSLVALLPLSLILDVVRGWSAVPLKGWVFLSYFGILIWSFIAARVLSALLRKVSLRVIFFKDWPLMMVMLGVAGLGIIRVSFTGWYPLNYYQPALLLLTVGWCALQMRQAEPSFQRRFSVVLMVALCCAIGYSYQNLKVPKGAVPYSSPFGTVYLSGDDLSIADRKQILNILSKHRASDAVFCSYEPSLQLLSGMRSAAWYTYFNRTGASGSHLAEREAQGLEFLQKIRPLYVVLELERAKFSLRLGRDYGTEILKYLEQEYELIHESPPGALRQIKVLRRRARG